MHVDAVGASVPVKLHADVRFLLVKTDHLPVLASFVGLGGPAEIDRLQDICLSLGIFPVKNIGAGIQRKLQRLIISKIFQFDRFDYHSAPALLFFQNRYRLSFVGKGVSRMEFLSSLGLRHAVDQNVAFLYGELGVHAGFAETGQLQGSLINSSLIVIVSISFLP